MKNGGALSNKTVIALGRFAGKTLASEAWSAKKRRLSPEWLGEIPA